MIADSEQRAHLEWNADDDSKLLAMNDKLSNQIVFLDILVYLVLSNLQYPMYAI